MAYPTDRERIETPTLPPRYNGPALRWYSTMDYDQLMSELIRFAGKITLIGVSGGTPGIFASLRHVILTRDSEFTEHGATIDYRPVTLRMRKVEAMLAAAICE